LEDHNTDRAHSNHQPADSNHREDSQVKVGSRNRATSNRRLALRVAIHNKVGSRNKEVSHHNREASRSRAGSSNRHTVVVSNRPNRVSSSHSHTVSRHTVDTLPRVVSVLRRSNSVVKHHTVLRLRATALRTHSYQWASKDRGKQCSWIDTLEAAVPPEPNFPR